MAISWPLTFPAWTPAGKNYVPADDGRAQDGIAKMGDRIGRLLDAVNELAATVSMLSLGTVPMISGRPASTTIDSASGAITIDTDAAEQTVVKLAGNVTVTVTGPYSTVVLFVQPAAGGATVTYAGSPLSISTAASAVTVTEWYPKPDGTFLVVYPGAILVDADKMAIARGYYEVVSPTPPAQATYAASNGAVYPVVWTKPLAVPVPVVPAEPLWDDFNQKVTVPSLVGLDYVITSATPNGGTASAKNVIIPPGSAVDVKTLAGMPTAVPFAITITAVARLGYTLPAAYAWSHNFPDQSVVTLMASDSFTASGATAPYPLDNYAGAGTLISPSWSVLGTDGAGAYPFTPSGGVLTTPANNVKGNAYTYLRLLGTKNIRVTFDVVSLGGNTSNSTNGSILSIGTRTSTFAATGGWWIEYGYVAGQGKKVRARINGVVTVLSTLAADIIGTWTIQIYGVTGEITDPKGVTFTFDLTSMNLDTQANGSDGFQIRSFNGTDTGTALDNFRFYKMGF